MLKGLEALRKLDYEARYANTDDEGYSIKPYKATNFCEEEFNIIEKELKALEIIKTKRVDVFELLLSISNLVYRNPLERYNSYVEGSFNTKLTPQEFDLLEEVLEE